MQYQGEIEVIKVVPEGTMPGFYQVTFNPDNMVFIHRSDLGNTAIHLHVSRINATLPAYQGRMMETGYPGNINQPDDSPAQHSDVSAEFALPSIFKAPNISIRHQATSQPVPLLPRRKTIVNVISPADAKNSEPGETLVVDCNSGGGGNASLTGRTN